MVNSHDVAQRAGLSQSTVSRVLNGSDKVRPETRQRVFDALHALNYVPNAQAQAMRRNRSDAIGIVTSDITNPFFPLLLDALTRENHRRNLKTILWNEKSVDIAFDAIARGIVDGACLVSATTVAGVEALGDNTTPIVLVNRGLDNVSFDQITSDNLRAGELAANYLIGTGRHRIGAIFGARTITTGPQREEGFTRTLKAAGLEIPEQWTFHGPSEFATGYAAVEQLLRGELPEALFCNSDPIAFGALSRLRGHGVRVPEDIWVMGIDGLPMGAWEVFDLTTIAQPIDAMAKGAIDMLVARINGDHGERQIVELPVELEIRGSTAHTPLST